MESFGLVPEICWSSFEEQIQFDQETNAMAQLIESQFFGYEQSSSLLSMLWPYNEASTHCYLSDPNAGHEGINYHAMQDDEQLPSFFQIDAANPFDGPNEADECDLDAVPAERLKRKARVQKAGKNSRSRKKQKGGKGGRDEEAENAINGGLNVQSSSSCSSEEEYCLNSSQEIAEGGSASSSSKGSTALNLNGKARAGRGAATDPQSLYARKRRERINERLRILQNLVPNGTKVDISTMLEEAVQYVKFLQVQIKLLSSDELWMFAPLAYNGMNIGLDLMLPTNKL